ncbi:MAG: hypothetical protein QXX12_00780 [Nanopusillaceae archaeon]
MSQKFKQYKIERTKESDVTRTIPITEIDLRELGVTPRQRWELGITPSMFFEFFMDSIRPTEEDFFSFLKKYEGILTNKFIKFLLENGEKLRTIMNEFRDKEKILVMEENEYESFLDNLSFRIEEVGEKIPIPELVESDTFREIFVEFIDKMISYKDMAKAYEILENHPIIIGRSKERLEILKKVRDLIADRVERILVIYWGPFSCIAIKLK